MPQIRLASRNLSSLSLSTFLIIEISFSPTRTRGVIKGGESVFIFKGPISSLDARTRKSSPLLKRANQYRWKLGLRGLQHCSSNNHHHHTSRGQPHPCG